MHDEIEGTPLFADHVQHAVDAVQILNIDLFDDLGADGLRKRRGTAPESTRLIAECQLRALTMQDPGNAPGD